MKLDTRNSRLDQKRAGDIINTEPKRSKAAPGSSPKFKPGNPAPKSVNYNDSVEEKTSEVSTAPSKNLSKFTKSVAKVKLANKFAAKTGILAALTSAEIEKEEPKNPLL